MMDEEEIIQSGTIEVQLLEVLECTRAHCLTEFCPLCRNKFEACAVMRWQWF
jgi:hypothetical protein